MLLVDGVTGGPDGLTLQVTPEKSLVVAVTSRVCPSVKAALRGETDTEIVAGLTVRGSVTEAVSTFALESLTLKDSERRLPSAVGVPESEPLDAPKARPAGKEPPVSDHRYGGVPPLAASVAE